MAVRFMAPKSGRKYLNRRIVATLKNLDSDSQIRQAWLCGQPCDIKI